MADEHALPAAEEEKKHGDELENVVNSGAERSAGTETHGSPIPAPENGGHARSVAAHLQDHSHLHDNIDVLKRHTPTNTNTLREPPQQISRVGKGHRGE